jgi:hypothetical protein
MLEHLLAQLRFDAGTGSKGHQLPRPRQQGAEQKKTKQGAKKSRNRGKTPALERNIVDNVGKEPGLQNDHKASKHSQANGKIERASRPFAGFHESLIYAFRFRHGLRLYVSSFEYITLQTLLMD